MAQQVQPQPQVPQPATSASRIPHLHQQPIQPLANGRTKSEEDVFVGVVPGIYAKDAMLPLRSMVVKATVFDFVADVELTQRFVNSSETAIEAVYVPSSLSLMHS